MMGHSAVAVGAGTRLGARAAGAAGAGLLGAVQTQ